MFNTPKINRRKAKLLNLAVVILFIFILAGTTAPFVAKLGVNGYRIWQNIMANLAFNKGQTVAPIAQSFEDQIKEKLDPAIFEVKEIRPIDDYSVEGISTGGVIAIFGNQTDLDNQVSSLQSLLVKSRIEAKPVKKIDLRFNKTVVEYLDKSVGN